jgi:hypothetical protein
MLVSLVIIVIEKEKSKHQKFKIINFEKKISF